MIKQIQLRGISRSPSDRMSEDGGLDESLNLYIDSAESAPALVPENVTSKLGLPADLQAEKVFIHKTANYENTIVYAEGNLKAYNRRGKVISSFNIPGVLNNIVSHGNMLVVLLQDATHYVLFRGGEYVDLGTDIPFPKLEISGSNTDGTKDVEIDIEELGVPGMYRAFNSSEYNQYKNDKINSDENVQKILNKLGEQKAAIAGELGEGGAFWGPVYVMYGITLYNGTVITSVPELVSRSSGGYRDRTWGLTLSSKYEISGQNKEFVGGINAEIDLKAFFLSVKAVEDYNLTDWKDLISSVEIYVSLPVDTASDYRRIELTEVVDDDSSKTRTASAKWGVLDTETELLNKGNFYAVKSYDLTGKSGGVVPSLYFAWNSEDYDVTSTSLATSLKQLPRESVDQIYVDELPVVAKDAQLYNDKLLLTSAANLLTYRGISITEAGSSNLKYSAKLKFVLDDGGVIYSDDGITLPSSGILTFASQNALSVEMLVRRDRKIYLDQDGADYEIETTYSYLVLPMSPHPAQPCSYAYIGLGKKFAEYAFEQNGTMTEQEALDYVNFNEEGAKYLSLENKILVSSGSNPFVYPEEKRITFQSKVLGVAIATSALSQGQFGQFPLYVFTEDGIWAMETAADGSFVTSKPLSRDVCVNPDSITSIDNAVVFVTAKSVMLLQGSQVMDISPYMSGRHYVINRQAEGLISGSDYASLIPAITDDTPFMAFMRKASIAYDYPGKRLICIAADEDYQYVYKMDTQTWHKSKHNRVKPLLPVNSYPECYVQGQGVRETVTRVYLRVTQNNSQEEYEYLVERIRLRLPNLRDEDIDAFLNMEGMIDVTSLDDSAQDWLFDELNELNVVTVFEEREEEIMTTRIYDFSTVLDGSREQKTERGVIVTRPMDLGYADVKKVIKDIRIRGQFESGHVKCILQGSDDGVNFFNTALRQKSWKLFRIIIVCNLDRHERISWMDIDFDIRYNNKLR